MNRSVYYIGRNMPVPRLIAIHEIILQTNVQLSGRKNIHQHVKVIEVTHYDGSIGYDGAIIFENDRAESEFLSVARGRDFSVQEHLLYDITPYIEYGDRVMIEQVGDGHLSLWVHTRDEYVHLYGDGVDAPAWDLPSVGDGIIVKDLILAGDHNAVNTIKRRFKYRMRSLHNSVDYKRGKAKGLTAHDWEAIVKDLAGCNATVLVVTDQGLVIKITSSGMTWVRPTNELSSRKYPQLREAGYVKRDVSTWVKPSRYINPKSPTKFAESVRYIALSSEMEANR